MHLQIDRVYLSHLHMLVFPQAQQSAALAQGTWRYKLASNHQAIHRAHYRVMLTLKAELKHEDKEFAQFEIQLTGQFSLIQSCTVEQLTYALKVSCPQLVYAYLQTRVSALSQHMALPTFTLPQLNFHEVIQQANQAQTNKNAADNTVQASAQNPSEKEAAQAEISTPEEASITVKPPLAIIPELALGMTLAQMAIKTVEKGKSWWKGEQENKAAAAAEVSYEEQQEAQAKLGRLKKQVDNLLKQEGLEQWCQHSLEDLAEELAKGGRKPISLACIRTWQLELATIKADYGLENNRTLFGGRI